MANFENLGGLVWWWFGFVLLFVFCFDFLGCGCLWFCGGVVLLLGCCPSVDPDAFLCSADLLDEL